MPRLTRAQRAAVGPAMVKALGTHREPTRAQTERVAQLRQDFGKAVKSVRAVTRDNHHLPVIMATGAGDAVWLFDTAGNYVTRYTQRALFDERHTDDAARSGALPQTHSQ